MTSSIGQGAYAGEPINSLNIIEHPKAPLRGSTSGIGGQSSETCQRYPAEPTHIFKYYPGSNFSYGVSKKLYKTNIYQAAGTWGKSVLRKYNPVKQIGGSSGYLDQQPGISKRSYNYKVMANIGRVVKNPRLPRGGSVPRIFGIETGDTGEELPAVPPTEIPPHNPVEIQETFGGNMDKPLTNGLVRGATGITDRRNSQYIQAGVQTTDESDQLNYNNVGGADHFESKTDLGIGSPTNSNLTDLSEELRIGVEGLRERREQIESMQNAVARTFYEIDQNGPGVGERTAITEEMVGTVVNGLSVRMDNSSPEEFREIQARVIPLIQILEQTKEDYDNRELTEYEYVEKFEEIFVTLRNVYESYR